MRTLSALAALLGFFALAGDAKAQDPITMSDRGAWNSMSEVQRSAYALGLFEGFLLESVHATDLESANASGLRTCARELRWDHEDLATLISEGYAGDASNWSRSPVEVLIPQVFRACRTFINAERSRRGLELLP